MMSEAVLQILLILTYLAIGLLSVTFPIYALCVTYLKEEKYAAAKECKRSMEKAKNEIIKLTNEMSAEKEGTQRFLELRRKVRDWQLELDKLENRPYFLTAKGAVLFPLISLLLALLSTCIGIFYYYEEIEQGVFGGAMFSLIFSSTAIFALYRTLCTVEHAALRGAVEIEVASQFMETGTPTQEVKVGEKVLITIGSATFDMNLEMANFRIFFPAVIEVDVWGEGVIRTPQPTMADFPNYVMFEISRDFLPKGTFCDLEFRILVKQVGEYKILIILNAKGIEESIAELTLKVVT
jgi:hypothetical protein